MITVSQITEELIKQTPFLEESLINGTLNLSGYARMVRPYIKKRLYKDVSEAAIVMALRRMAPRAKTRRGNINLLKQAINITVRSGLIEYVFPNSLKNLKLAESLQTKIATDQNMFVNLSQGVSEITIIVSEMWAPKLEVAIPHSEMIAKIDDLSSITIKLPQSNIYTVGVYYPILKALAWENINLIEAISSYSEITIFVKSKDIERAFACIKSITKH